MKKILPLVCLMFAALNASAAEAPQKFKNPIFNNILWSVNVNGAHDTRLTPTHLYDLQYPENDEKCEYITEDEKGILMNCIDPEYKDIEGFYMFFIKYHEPKYCDVWWCSFWTKDKKTDLKNIGYPDLLNSDIPCPEEDVYPVSFSDLPKCLEELKDRGWDKYIPTKAAE